MVLTLWAGLLVLPQSLVCVASHSWLPVATPSVFIVLGGGNTEGGEEAGLLSKSRSDGKHKVINLRPDCMFGEQIPPRLWEEMGSSNQRDTEDIYSHVGGVLWRRRSAGKGASSDV